MLRPSALALCRSLGLLAVAAGAIQIRPPPASAPFANTSAVINSSSVLLSPASSPFLPSSTPQLSDTTTTAPSHGNRTLPTFTPASTPAPTGVASVNQTTKALNSTLAPCIVNIPNANLEWWYLATFTSAAGRFKAWSANVTNADQFLTMVPNTEIFDVSSTISSEYAWTPTVVSDEHGEWTDYDLYAVTPTAATTSIVTRNGAPPLPPGNIIPASDSASYFLTDLPPATVTIPGKANATSAITSATPFLYFSEYEIESVSNGTTATSTISLAEPSATEYWIKGIENSASASGSLPDDFLRQLGHSTCSPGTVRGEVTVLIVLDIVWLRASIGNPFLVHVESSALGFETTDSDMAVAGGETSTDRPFTANPVDPKWTEDLGKTTQAESAPTVQATMPQPGNERTIESNVLQPTQQTVGSVGTNPIIVAPSSVVVVGSQTLKPGAPAVSIGGRPVSLAPSATAIVVGGTTSALPIVASPGSPAQSIGTVGGRPIVVDSSSAIIIGTATLNPGQPAVTIGGTAVSIVSLGTAIVVGGKTSNLPQVIFPAEPIPTQPPAPPVLTIGSSSFTANAATQFFLGPGQTLVPGGSATLDGTIVSLGPSASFVVVGGSTQNLQSSPSQAAFRPEIVVGGTTITALPVNSNGQHGLENQANSAPGPSFVISGQTLVPGHAITVDGTTISLAPSGSFIVVGGVTSTLPPPAAVQVTPPPITAGGGVYTPLPGPGTSYSIGNSILTPGGEITVSGTTISLAPDGSYVVVNGVTSSLPGQAHATITNPPVLTIGSQTITAAPGTGTTFIISGQTLTPGGTITVDGTTISLAPGATEVVYGSAGRSTTEVLFPATTTRVYITSESAPASAGSTGGNGQPAATNKTAGAGQNVPDRTLKSWIVSMMIGAVAWSLQ